MKTKDELAAELIDAQWMQYRYLEAAFGKHCRDTNTKPFPSYDLEQRIKTTNAALAAYRAKVQEEQLNAVSV